MRAGVIYNPSAGRGHGSGIAVSVERALTKRGFEVDLHATGQPRDAMTIAERIACQVDVVVAIGGDGTINEVVNGMATRAGALPTAESACPKAKLGIVPAGTVNVLALELGLPFQVERACNAIAEGKTVSLDVGQVNDRGFVLMTGAGIDALTVRNVDPRQKRRFRELAFLGTGLRWGLAADPPAFVVRAGGEEYTATFFVASNCRYYAGHLGITPHADPTDGLLDLLIFTGTTRSSLAVFWLGVPSGLHMRSPNVKHLRAARAELIPLSDKETVYFQTDGELAGKLPAVVKIDAHALEVVVP
jgi:diacylglycerol kinase (ATP)